MANKTIYLLETQAEYDTPTVIGWTDNKEKAIQWVNGYEEEKARSIKEWYEYNRRLDEWYSNNPEPKSKVPYIVMYRSNINDPEWKAAMDAWEAKRDSEIGPQPDVSQFPDRRYIREVPFADLGE